MFEGENAWDCVYGHACSVTSRDVLGELDLPTQDEDRHDALAARAASCSSNTTHVLRWLPGKIKEDNMLNLGKERARERMM